ncbi:hypothetical protein AGLY_001991 [Aphis glycines]|uniref:Uncharacterized protein n=1 Tax=Aphis glycines TaxID=307491 RepID=A0A6G0U3R4_APHGL|nr:hypothetical protein AGLY_001991 [Aphis glycines]
MLYNSFNFNYKITSHIYCNRFPINSRLREACFLRDRICLCVIAFSFTVLIISKSSCLHLTINCISKEPSFSNSESKTGLSHLFGTATDSMVSVKCRLLVEAYKWILIAPSYSIILKDSAVLIVSKAANQKCICSEPTRLFRLPKILELIIFYYIIDYSFYFIMLIIASNGLKNHST